MHSRRLLVLLCLAVIAMLAVPTVALALDPRLVNDYGLEFAGKAKCLECHASYYDATTHGQFAQLGANPPASDTWMWPAGRPSVGELLDADQIGFSLGAGTGILEYLVWDPAINYTYGNPARTAANGPLALAEGMEWSPEAPDTWEIGTTGIEPLAYGCGQCHQLGTQKTGLKPKSGHGSTAATATVTKWAMYAGADEASLTSFVPGSSIQCELCHGTGVTTGLTHWGTGVQIVGGWGASFGNAASKTILDSRVCGQCHASWKSGSNTVGYTPDVSLYPFVNMYGFNDIPSAAQFAANPSGYRYFPNGLNYRLNHSYYVDWQLSGHSYRGRLTSTSPEASLYQKTGAGHYNAATSDVKCARCHTGEGYLKRKGAAIMADWQEGVDQAGNYGQECATCHIAHKTDGSPDEEGGPIGMQVREPDAAGVGSNAGRTTANMSICEDCHNWQQEIMGTTLQPLTSGRGPSHPQREVIEGRGMFEVAEAGQFMPNAKCEFCHMPSTNSERVSSGPRYDQRPFKRYSHRMFIMMPGDAKTYEEQIEAAGYSKRIGPWADSCSPCHAGETQDELQAFIDDTQSELSALDASVLAAYNAAKTRAEFSTAAGTALAGRAYQNEKFFNNDSSSGFHNPPYMKAGLDKALFMAKAIGGYFDELYASTPMSPQSPFGAISGNVHFGDDTNAAGADITLLRNGIVVGSTKTDANGNFSFMIAESGPGTYAYSVRWDRISDSAADITESFNVVVNKFSSRTTLTASATSIYYGRYVTLRGAVTPSAAGQLVTVQYRRGTTGSWYKLGTATLSSASAYAKTVKPSARGYWYYRVVYSGTSTVAGSISPTVKVYVR